MPGIVNREDTELAVRRCVSKKLVTYCGRRRWPGGRVLRTIAALARHRADYGSFQHDQRYRNAVSRLLQRLLRNFSIYVRSALQNADSSGRQL